MHAGSRYKVPAFESRPHIPVSDLKKIEWVSRIAKLSNRTSVSLSAKVEAALTIKTERKNNNDPDILDIF